MFRAVFKDWQAKAQNEGISVEEYYTREACQVLQDNGWDYLADNFCYVPDTRVGQEPVYISGYSYEEEGRELTLTITIFSQPDEQKSEPDFLTKGKTEDAYRHARMFFRQIQNGVFDTLSPGSVLYNLVAIVRNWLGRGFNIGQDSLRMVLITDFRVKAEYVPQSVELQKNGVSVRCDYMDYTHVMNATAQPPEMDFTSRTEGGIGYLPVRTNDNVDFFDAYLLVIPGADLAECYDKYKDRVLEKNVRGYLRATKTNKKIRNTITKEPDMFFLFNNGLTLTANEIVEENGKIKKLKGVQIVNGGQTTATIHESWSKDKESIAHVYIQAKLTIVPASFADGLVKDISICSNTQNAVTDVDLRRSDVIQRALERYSRMTPTPNKTYWYYERVKKQRLNARTLLKGKRNQDFFDDTYPSKQSVNAEKLATAVMAFEGKPWLVSQGTTKVLNLSEGFSAVMNKLLQDNPDYASARPELFKDCVAKFILYEKYLTPRVQKLVKSRYEGHTEASRMMLAYAVNTYVLRLAETGKSIDFAYIWNRQKPSEELMQSILSFAEKVIEISHDHPRTWFRSKENWNKYFVKITRTLAWQRFNASAPDIKNELPVRYSEQVRTKDESSDSYTMRITMPIMQEYFSKMKSLLENFNCEQKLKDLIEKRLQHPSSMKASECKQLYELAEEKENKITGLKSQLPFSIVLEKQKPTWEQIAGDSVELFAKSLDNAVYICFCSIENAVGNTYLRRLLDSSPSFAEEFEADETTPELGDVRLYSFSDTKSVVLMYTERTVDSMPYHRIYEACFQALAAKIPAPTSGVQPPEFFIECSSLFAYSFEMLRGLVNMFSSEMDYAIAKWICQNAD